MSVKTIVKNALILFVITLLSGLLLGVAYQITKGPIAERQARGKKEAYQSVFSEAQSFEEDDAINGYGISGVTVTECLKAVDGSGTLLGYVMTLDFAGSQGEITMAYGEAVDGTTMGIDILTSSETAKLGALADEPEFKDQFQTKTDEFVLNDNIDQISGATITSNAVVNAANGGMAFAAYCAKGE